MTYRPITQAEIPIVAEIQSRAFRTDANRYVEAYSGSGRFGWQDQRLFENEQGEAVAALSVFFRPMSLAGGALEAALVASVAVPPEWRRRGYGRQMMTALLEELHARRTPLSLLFPFSVAWYRSLGYGVANLTWHMEIAPRLLSDFAERLAVRRAFSDDELGIRACHAAAMALPQNNGWLPRGDWEWQKRVWKPEHEVVVYVDQARIEGYLVYTLAFGGDASPARVVEWVWTTDAAWRGLAGFLAALGEQAQLITYNAPQQSPLLWVLREPYDRTGRPAEFVFYPAARLVNGFMARVVHLEEALAQRRYPAQVVTEFDLLVDDPQLPANRQPLRVRIAGGIARVKPISADTRPASGSTSLVACDITTFGELYAGVLSAESARTAGRLRADDSGCAALTAAFACPSWYMLPADYF
jgi:predicted acetyltransferase